MFRDVLTKYPLIANSSSQQSDILFPQVLTLLRLYSCIELTIAFLFDICTVSNTLDIGGDRAQ